MAIFIVLVITLYFQYSYCAPGVHMALMYLSNYGYMEPNSMSTSSSQTNAKTFRSSIKEFQSFMKLPVTGKLDRATIKVMSMSRCGVKDKIGRAGGRNKRYALQGSTWKTKMLTYNITKYPTKLQRMDVDRTIAAAFNLWSNHSDLMFERSKNYTKKVNIEIKFVEGKHGDDNPFEGPGGVLAHAYFPEFGGAAHFDNSEPWIINSPNGTNLIQVANHEIGHSLGLSHSDEIDASMSPLYNDYVPDFMLHQDDVEAIQKLYGRRKASPELPLDPTEEEWMNYWDSWAD